jgi:hypothetical protein
LPPCSAPQLQLYALALLQGGAQHQQATSSNNLQDTLQPDNSVVAGSQQALCSTAADDVA